MWNAELLSRIQFGFVMSFHTLFAAFSIGLAGWLVFLEALWLFKRTAMYRVLYFFWLKVFTLVFALGVISGIVMSFQFGTNWAGLSTIAGNVLGPMLDYEAMIWLFLEATFLGVMLFGWKHTGHKTHFLATCMTWVTMLCASFWVIAANSWMQTPQGYNLIDGTVRAANWQAIIFNPSALTRFIHATLSSLLMTAWIIGGVAAIYLWRQSNLQMGRFMFRCALVCVALVSGLQMFSGVVSTRLVTQYQPAKQAAMNAQWQTQHQAGLSLYAHVDTESETNTQALTVPWLGSWLFTGSIHGKVKGLNDFPPAERPPVTATFVSFRIMAGLGVLMLLIALAGLRLWRRGLLDHKRWYLATWMGMMPSGLVALIAGWCVAEIGRQPWVVYGVLRTSQAASVVALSSVLASLVVYALTYVVLFGFGIGYVIWLLSRQPTMYLPEKQDQFHAATNALAMVREDEEETA